LQKHGCDVYRIIAGGLDMYHQDYFSELAKEAGEKTVVLLVDGSQRYDKWTLELVIERIKTCQHACAWSRYTPSFGWIFASV
jgi:hypothetical protein